MRHAPHLMRGLLLAAAVHTAPVSADTLIVPVTQLGGFLGDGSFANDEDFQNYYVGYSTLTSRAERRSFFVFDVPVFAPGMGELVGIDFAIRLPTGGLVFGKQLDTADPPMPYSDTEETFALSLTPFTADLVTSPLDSATAATVFDALGSADLGSVTISSDEMLPFEPPPPGFYPLETAEVIVPFSPAGMGLFVGSVAPGTPVVLGGVMTSWTANDELEPGSGGLVEKSELMFGLSDYRTYIAAVDSVEFTGLPSPELRFHFAPVPLPGGAVMLLPAVAALGLVRRRGRRDNAIVRS